VNSIEQLDHFIKYLLINKVTSALVIELVTHLLLFEQKFKKKKKL